MAKNDVVLLDGIVDQRLADGIPSADRSEVFEFLVLEEMLKNNDLTVDEIATGWVDGRDDGGLDGAFLFVNGHLVDDLEDFPWPRSNAAINVWLITCKHHSSFRQATLDALIASITELLDLARPDEDLEGSYSTEILDWRSRFAAAYRRLSIGRPALQFNVVYASRGDTTDIGESVAARARQVKSTIEGLFSSCSVEFNFVGASELVEAHRRSRTFALDLPFLEHLATGRDSYVLLARLEDYWRFVSDETGNLRRYLFDSNVRDYLGNTAVNQDIAKSLADEAGPDFWWLNNGVTILATNATVPGKTIKLQDIQIVNGLQTTEAIHHHFHGGATASLNRALLVKIVVSSDPQDRDRIIRATNNQNPVEVAALRATDKIQRDIEDILERHGWYYERRRNYYRNIGKPQSRFVTPMYLASAAVALVLRNPRSATKLKPKFMRSQDAYESVFDSGIPIEIWPRMASVFKGVDAALSRLAQSYRRGERFLTNWRPLVALLVVARQLGRFDYGLSDFLAVDPSQPLTEQDVTAAWQIVLDTESSFNRDAKARMGFMLACCALAASRYGLGGVEIVGKRSVAAPQPLAQPADAISALLTEDFVQRVDAALPKQPWPPGVHVEIASVLGCNRRHVLSAIRRLIEDGLRYRQKDGVVYDAGGAVIARDPTRLPVEALDQ